MSNSWSTRRAVLVLLAVVALAFVALEQQLLRAQKQIEPPPGGATGTPIPADPTEFSDNISLPKDNQLKARIEAAVDYIKTEDWVQATLILQRLVEIPEDKFAQIQRPGTDGKLTKVWTSVKTEADRLIAKLDKPGMDYYKLTYGPPAGEMLKKARETGNAEMLGQVMSRFLHTDAGGEATNLLGTYHLDRGSFVTASLCFERLFNRDGIDKLPSLTLFKAAYAFHQANDKANENRAWKELNSRSRGVQIGQEMHSVKELQDYVNTLVRLNAEHNQADWPMFGGKASRNARGEGDTAFMENRWSYETVRFQEVRDWLRNAANLLQQRNQPILPAAFPVTATVNKGGTKIPLVVYRSYWGLHARNMKTGKLEWDTRSDWSLDRMVKDTKKVNAANQFVNYYMQQRPSMLFENSTIGTMSTDGTLLFAVEDLAVPPPPQFAVGNGQFNPGVNALGEEVVKAIAHSKLQAFDLLSGKLKWELGGIGEKGELNDSYFLGAPLPMAGKLYVLTEKQQELRLVCIDAVTGKVLTSQTLAQTKDKMMQDVARRIQATHLAYGEGMLVAPTNAGAILAIDLLTNRLVWAYPYREKGDTPAAEVPVNPGIRIRRGIGMPQQPQFNPAANNHWKVSAPIIQDGKVLFTAPDARAIHCINLRDGTRVWSLPRGEDDLYLGGVYGGKVLIVGRKSVRGVSLSKGETLWHLETGLPSGQGIASENIYYLPLKEAAQGKEPEICAIDMEKGMIFAHTKSRKKEVPGNLVFYEGDVLSQTATDIVAYPQLKVKLAQIDELIAKNPNDPLGLTERGELRLDKGDLEGAIEDLSASLRNAPPPAIKEKAKTKLYETLTEFFQRDFNGAEKFLKVYDDLCHIDVASVPEAERPEKEKEARRRRANFLCLVAKGRESQRKLVEAFEKYQEFATLTNTEELISVIDEPTVKTAPDVWSQGRIAAMVLNASEEDRKPLEEKIRQKWSELQKSNDLNELRKFVGVFGSLFAVGKEARLQLAERLMEDSDPLSLLDAERHLTLLRGRSEEPQLAARAIEALARLNTRKGWMEDAAYYYELLGREYAKVPVVDGKTGSDLYNDLATDKRFLPHLDKPSQANTGGKIKATEERGSFPYQHQTYQFGLQGENTPFFQRNQLVLRFDSHHLKMVDRSTNEERWDLALTRTMFQNLVYGQQGARFSYQNMGHLVVLPLGHMVYGINPVTGKQLWEKNLQAPITPASTATPPAYNQLIVDPQDNSLQVIYPDGWIQRLGQTGSLEGTVICLQTREALVAIDPLTGRTLWTRSDVSSRSHVFSDAQYVYVVEINADNKPTGTRALRAYDGVSVKLKDFTANYLKRVRMLGRHILLSETDATGKLEFRLYDVLTGKDLWTAGVPQNSTQLRSEDPNLLGLVEPDGKVHVYNLRTLKEVLTSRMDPRHLDKLVSAHLLADGRDFFIACNGQVDPNLMPFGGVQTNLMAGTGMRAIPVNGMVYSFDGATGKVRWYNKVANQMMVLDRFEDIPIVLFTARYQKWNQNGPVRNPVQVVSAKSMSKATGKLLYDNENLPNGMNFHALKVDGRAGRIEFEGYAMKIIHILNSEAGAN